MKRKLFRKLHSKKEGICGTLGLVLSKLLIFLIDVPPMLFSCYLIRESHSLLLVIVGLALALAVIASYLYLNMNYLIQWEMVIEEKLFKLFYKRASTFYELYNTGSLSYSRYTQEKKSSKKLKTIDYPDMIK